MSPELAESRELEGLAANGVVRDALVGRKAFRPLLDRLAYRAVDVGTSVALTRLGHDHCDEPTVSLQHADLTDRGALHVGSLDGLGLDVLAARGHDQGRYPARDVEITVIEVAQVSRAEPSVFIEDLAGLFGPVAVAGEDVRATGEDLTFRACTGSSLGHGRGVDADLDAGNRASDTA